MTRPRLLDLFCGAGGAAAGYVQAGFDVVGVDSAPQPHYPYAFIQADAMTFPLDGFDVIHASPPCQHYTMMLNHGMASRNAHPDLVGTIRERLAATGKPYIIENVMGAPVQGIRLCGGMFGLRMYRHRLFESNTLLFAPYHPAHIYKAAHAGIVPQLHEFWSICGHFANRDGARAAMDVEWMQTKYEIAQAIPPVYTDYLGAQLLYALRTTESGGAA